MQRTIEKTMRGNYPAVSISAVEDISQWRLSYLRVLKVVLQDTIEEVRMMIVLCRKRQKSEEITSYVRRQNTALFLREIAGLSTLLKDLDTVDPNRYNTQEEMIQFINGMFEKKILKYDFPQAIHGLVKYKFAEISKYILNSHIDNDA